MSAEACIILAGKMYEKTLVNLWQHREVNGFNVGRYIKEEKEIFLKMDFCLFVYRYVVYVVYVYVYSVYNVCGVCVFI